MSFSQVSSKIMTKTVDTSETIQMGSSTFPAGTTYLNLKYIRAALIIVGRASLAGSEQMRTIVYSDSGYTAALSTSSWFSLNSTNLPNFTGNSWVGMVRTDHSLQGLSNQKTYYIGTQFQNYTRNGTTFYFGLLKDWPNPRNMKTTLNPFAMNCAFEIFGYQAAVVGQ